MTSVYLKSFLVPAILAFAPACAPAFADEAEAGREIAAKWCAECHATEAAPRAADVGPSFREIAANRSEEWQRGFLANPHVRGDMPPFDLSEAQIGAIVAWIAKQR